MSAKQSEPAGNATDGPLRREEGHVQRRTAPWQFLRLSDESAMERVQSGDHQAFSLLVRRWEGPIQRLCTRMTGDAHMAQDLTQEAFARLFAARASYRPGARFSTFLWRIALNACCDERRRRASRPETLLDAYDDGPDGVAFSAASPDAAAAQREEGELVRAAVAGLPEHYRAVVVLRHYEGLKFREVAEVLGIPEGTVKSRMAEALDRLAEALAGLRADGSRGPQ